MLKYGRNIEEGNFRRSSPYFGTKMETICSNFFGVRVGELGQFSISYNFKKKGCSVSKMGN